jgi:hypothetical protein
MVNWVDLTALLALQQPAPDDTLRIVATGAKQDGAYPPGGRCSWTGGLGAVAPLSWGPG